MKTPASNNEWAERLRMPALAPDPQRLALLETALTGGRERPGQVLAVLQSDCGLARLYWQEIQALRANVWLGLHEALVAHSRDELRRWIIALQREQAARSPGAGALLPGDSPEAALLREHGLRRALVARALLAQGWEGYDPGTDTDRGVLGVRSIFERYLLVLNERIFLVNLGVVAFPAWFRPPLEEVVSLNLDALRSAMENRWAAAAEYFPALTAPLADWTAAHQRAGDAWPAQALIDAQVLELMRRAGLIEQTTRPLQGA